ncbi:gliding motility-associated C-terminal domain-containing protein, partial [Pedobacter lithocola]
WYNETGQVLQSAPTPSTAVAGTLKYYVAQKFSTGCEGPKAEIVVTINPLPAAPTVSATLAYCQNQTGIPALTATKETNAVLVWYNETGQILPSAPIPSTATVGTQKYYVAQKFSTGCEGPKAEILVSISPLGSKPLITSSGNLQFCSGGSVILTSSTAYQYQWYKDNQPVIGATGKSITITLSGEYRVETKNVNGCSSLLSDPIVVVNEGIPTKPIITATTAIELCQGEKATLKSSATSGNQWYRNGNIIPGAIDQIFQTFLDGSYTVKTKTPAGCESLISEPISLVFKNLLPPPSISPIGEQVICRGGKVTLSSSSTTGNQWFKDGVLIPGAVNQTYVATSGGVYSAKAINTTGCGGTISNIVQVNEVDFKISLSANDELSQAGGSIVLQTSSNLKYKVVSWSPQNLFQKQDATTQSLNLKSNVNVIVNVMSENGCITSASLALNYNKKRDLFIPNTFTPNADGKNDFVKVYGNGIDAVEFMVYTQWGELIYRSKEKDASWDGNYRGLPQPVGVYLYKCVVRFDDGEELTKHGAINLLR